MYVLMGALSATDAENLGRACQRNRMSLHPVPSGGGATLNDDLLAVFFREGEETSLSVAEVRQHGAYSVQVQATVSAVSMLHAIRSGFHFVFPSPLSTDRITSFLRYMCDVAAPPRSQILTLTDNGTLVTPAGSVRLEDAERAALLLLSERADKIVSRADLMSATGGSEALRTVDALRRRFQELGSGAQILKVPHMGYRLVGTVRSGAAV